MATRHPDYERAHRRVHAYTHAPIPAPMHAEGAAWSRILREANAERERAALALTCTACGYVTSDAGWRSSDHAHDELCCQQPDAGLCRDLAVDLCITHDVWPGETVPSAVFVVAL